MFEHFNGIVNKNGYKKKIFKKKKSKNTILRLRQVKFINKVIIAWNHKLTSFLDVNKKQEKSDIKTKIIFIKNIIFKGIEYLLLIVKKNERVTIKKNLLKRFNQLDKKIAKILFQLNSFTTETQKVKFVYKKAIIKLIKILGLLLNLLKQYNKEFNLLYAELTFLKYGDTYLLTNKSFNWVSKKYTKKIKIFNRLKKNLKNITYNTFIELCSFLFAFQKNIKYRVDLLKVLNTKIKKEYNLQLNNLFDLGLMVQTSLLVKLQYNMFLEPSDFEFQQMSISLFEVDSKLLYDIFLLKIAKAKNDDKILSEVFWYIFAKISIMVKLCNDVKDLFLLQLLLYDIKISMWQDSITKLKFKTMVPENSNKKEYFNFLLLESESILFRIVEEEEIFQKTKKIKLDHIYETYFFMLSYIATNLQKYKISNSPLYCSNDYIDTILSQNHHYDDTLSQNNTLNNE